MATVTPEKYNEVQALLAKGDVLGNQASAITGVPYPGPISQPQVPTTPPVIQPALPGVVSSSAPIVAQENQTKTDVNNLTLQNSNTEADTTKAYQPVFDLIDQENKRLEAERESARQAIEADYKVQQQDLEQTQGKETANWNTTLARIGGYLGGTASHVGALQNLAQVHKADIARLEAKKVSAIQQAQQAISDKQFQLARDKAGTAKDLANEIQTRKDKFFEQTMSMMQEKRSQEEFGFQKKKYEQEQVTSMIDQYAKIAAAGGAVNLSPQKKQEIDNYFGAPGISDSYFDSLKSAYTAKTAEQKQDANLKLLNTLTQLPEGQKMTMPDGTSYTGVGSTGDITTMMEVDDKGIGHLITYNKGTGDVTTTALGVIGGAYHAPASSGGSSSGKGNLNIGTTPLENALFPILGKLPVALQADTVEHLHALVNSGKQAEAESFINTMGLQYMVGAAARKDFTSFGTMAVQAAKSQETLSHMQLTNFGPYKTLLESKKPYALVENDQPWIKVTQQINQAQTEYKRALFGTSLTESEKESGRQNFVDFKTDSLATIETKLAGMREFAATYRDQTLKDATGNFDVSGGGLDQYSAQRSQLQSGEILIQRNGKVGAISPSEFNPATDTKL